jgi:hypothetical protein
MFKIVFAEVEFEREGKSAIGLGYSERLLHR